jgi:hypothetical protein
VTATTEPGHTRPNYRAWYVRAADFPTAALPAEQLKYLVRYGVLAPSAHNTQPWHFTRNGDTLLLRADPSRGLEAGDPTGRQLHLSLGAATATIESAARGFGYEAQVSYEAGTDMVVRITLDESADPPQPELLDAILQRRNDRRPYTSDAQTPQLLDAISAVRQGSARVILFKTKEQVEKIAALVGRGSRIASRDRNFRQELARLIRGPATRHFDGMPGATFGWNPVQTVMIKLLMPLFDPGGPAARAIEAQVRATPAIGVVVADRDEPPAWLDAGRVAQGVALLATSRGHATSFYAAATEIGEMRSELNMLVASTEIPVLTLRVGRPLQRAAAVAPRRPAELVVTNAT